MTEPAKRSGMARMNGEEKRDVDVVRNRGRGDAGVGEGFAQITHQGPKDGDHSGKRARVLICGAQHIKG